MVERGDVRNGCVIWNVWEGWKEKCVKKAERDDVVKQNNNKKGKETVTFMLAVQVMNLLSKDRTPIGI